MNTYIAPVDNKETPNRFLLHFWKGFVFLFLCNLAATNQLAAFNTPMIELYRDMFSWITPHWLNVLSMWIVFLLLISSIFYQLHIVIKKDKEASTC